MGGAEPLVPAKTDVAGYQALRGQVARVAAMAELSRELAEVVPDRAKVAGIVVRRTAESLHDACVLHLLDDTGTDAGHIAVHDPHPEEAEWRAAALAHVVGADQEAEHLEVVHPPVLNTPSRVWLREPEVGQLDAMLGPRSHAYVREVGVSSLPPGSFTYGLSVQQTTDGGYVVGGGTIGGGSNTTCPALSGLQCAFVEKLSAGGRVIWAMAYRAGWTGSAINQIRQTADGGYVAVGSASDTSGNTGATY